MRGLRPLLSRKGVAGRATSTVKLNADAACDTKAGRAGIGFVIRDEVGGLVGAGSIPILGNPSVLAVEGLAVFHGMQFCLSEGLKRIEVESDVVNVINALNQNEVNLSMEGCIFDDIKELIIFLSLRLSNGGRSLGAAIGLPI